MGTDRVVATVIIVGYNSREDLSECLSSVCHQTIDNYEIVFVDNDSDDDSVEFVRREFPEIRVIANKTNRWYAGGNNDGLSEADGDYLVVLNPDVEVEDDWLEELIKPLEANPEVGLTTSRITYFDNRDILNTCGNVAHFTGLGFCRGLGASADAMDSPHYVGAVSGCSFAIRRDVYEKIGGFDETFENYLEDVDLSWRARLAGYDILYVPDSVVYHKYDFSLPSWKLFNMERNRYLILLKHLRLRTLVFILPSLVATELLIWGFALLTGEEAVKSKAKAWGWLLRNPLLIATKRKRIFAMRDRSDRELLREAATDLPLEQLEVPSSLAPVVERSLAILYKPWHRLAAR